MSLGLNKKPPFLCMEGIQLRQRWRLNRTLRCFQVEVLLSLSYLGKASRDPLESWKSTRAEERILTPVKKSVWNQLNEQTNQTILTRILWKVPFDFLLCLFPDKQTLLMTLVTLATYKCSPNSRRSTESADTQSLTTHLQAGWVMASTTEINSQRGDTIKAVRRPTSLHCWQLLIHKAGVSPEQRDRQEELLPSLSGLRITKSVHSYMLIHGFTTTEIILGKERLH